MRALILAFMSVAIGLIAPVTAADGQTPEPSQDAAVDTIETDSDPTRPVFFSIRPEFSIVRESVEQRALILRYDAAALPTRRLFGGLPGVILRFEVPFVGADAGGGRSQGLGDAYGQFVLVPYMKHGFLWVVGSGVVVPTATSDLLGGGKLVLGPMGAPVWKFPGGMFFVKVQNFTSVAGDTSRPDVNYLLITPLFVHAVRRDWWILADSETKTNWMRDGRTGLSPGCNSAVGLRAASGYGSSRRCGGGRIGTATGISNSDWSGIRGQGRTDQEKTHDTHVPI